MHTELRRHRTHHVKQGEAEDQEPVGEELGHQGRGEVAGAAVGSVALAAVGSR